MIAYNREWLDNLTIQRDARRWFRQKLITADELNAIKSKYPTSYAEQNIFARIGMFVLTMIIVLAGFLLLGAINNFNGLLAQLILFEVLCFICVERFFQSFRSGVTDALLYMAVIFFSFLFIMIVDNNQLNFDGDPLIYLVGITPFVILAAIRYTDAFLSAVGYLLIIVMNGLFLLKFGREGKLILPFDTMIMSLLFYSSFRKMKKKNNYHYWSHCIAAVETLSIVTFYLAGNYLVVRQLSEMLWGATYAHGTDIAFSYFFYAFTIITPLILVATGLVKKNYILIRAGVLLEAVGILSIKYYYSVMSLESALILSGTIVVLIAWLCIRYLKKPRFGFTMDDFGDSDQEASDVLRSMVISKATTNLRSNPGDSDIMKGGDSGGGGASRDY